MFDHHSASLFSQRIFRKSIATPRHQLRASVEEAPFNMVPRLLILGLPLMVADGPAFIHEPQEIDDGSTTKPSNIVARVSAQPSPYPLDNGPYHNEFQYVGWDPENPDHQVELRKIHAAFGQAQYMASRALLKVTEPDQTMIQRWFGTQEDPTEQPEVFANMWDADAGTAAFPVSQMVCDREDFRNFCRETMSAYTVRDTGRFHISPFGMNKPLNSDIACTDLDASCSTKMRSLPMVILHEWTHFDDIGAEGRGFVGIIDVRGASGAYECFKLAPEQKGDNAQNYAWFAGEAHWSLYCDKTSEDPTETIE